MEYENTQRARVDAGFGEVRVCLGGTTELTRGSGGGSSEDKRYVYN